MENNASYVLRTRNLKAYYMLEEPGGKKTVRAVDGVDLEHPQERNLRDCRGKWLWKEQP